MTWPTEPTEGATRELARAVVAIVVVLGIGYLIQHQAAPVSNDALIAIISYVLGFYFGTAGTNAGRGSKK